MTQVNQGALTCVGRRIGIGLVTILALLFWDTASSQNNSAKSAVVKILSAPAGSTRLPGTGFIVKLEADAAYIVTAAHVVYGDPAPQVEFPTRRHRPVSSRVIAAEADQALGLAILLVEGALPSNLTVLSVDTNSKLDGGEPITTVGHPMMGGNWAVIKGSVVSRQRGTLNIDAAIDRGSSGGPVLLSDRVIGVVMGKGRTYGVATSASVLGEFLASAGIDMADAPLRPEPKSEVTSARDVCKVPDPPIEPCLFRTR